MLTGGAGRAVLEAAGDQVAELEEQLELLPPSRFAPGSAAHVAMVDQVKRSGAGRPPGARNLATRDMVAFVRRVFGDPFLESARELLHTPASLAAELDCSKLEAFDRLERIRADLRPFMYARLAPIDGAGRPVAPAFTMVFGAAAPASSSSPDRPPWLEDFEQSQGLTLDQAPVSHDAVSHGDGK